MNQIAKIEPLKVELIHYEAMCTAIAAAYEVDEVKHIRDKAVAIQTYARLAQNTDAESKACKIRLRAERRAGELLAATEKQHGARGVGSRSMSPPKQQSLADMGISSNQSANWQNLAKIPEPVFEAAIEAPRPTTTSIIAAAAPPKRKNAVSDDALWLWGRLQAFAQFTDRDPKNVMATMTPEMRAQTIEWAPQISKWLGRIVP